MAKRKQPAARSDPPSKRAKRTQTTTPHSSTSQRDTTSSSPSSYPHFVPPGPPSTDSYNGSMTIPPLHPSSPATTPSQSLPRNKKPPNQYILFQNKLLRDFKSNKALHALIGQERQVYAQVAGKMWRHRGAEKGCHDLADFSPADTLPRGGLKEWKDERLEIIARGLSNHDGEDTLSKSVADWEAANPRPPDEYVWEGVSTPESFEAPLSSMPPPDIPVKDPVDDLALFIIFDGVKTPSSHPKPTTPKTRARSQSDKTSRARKAPKAKSTAAPPPISPAHPLPSSSIPRDAEDDVEGETDDTDPPVTQAATRVDNSTSLHSSIQHTYSALASLTPASTASSIHPDTDTHRRPYAPNRPSPLSIDTTSFFAGYEPALPSSASSGPVSPTPWVKSAPRPQTDIPAPATTVPSSSEGTLGPVPVVDPAFVSMPHAPLPYRPLNLNGAGLDLTGSQYDVHVDPTLSSQIGYGPVDFYEGYTLSSSASSRPSPGFYSYSSASEWTSPASSVSPGPASDTKPASISAPTPCDSPLVGGNDHVAQPEGGVASQDLNDDPSQWELIKSPAALGVLNDEDGSTDVERNESQTRDVDALDTHVCSPPPYPPQTPMMASSSSARIYMPTTPLRLTMSTGSNNASGEELYAPTSMHYDTPTYGSSSSLVEGFGTMYSGEMQLEGSVYTYIPEQDTSLSFFQVDGYTG